MNFVVNSFNFERRFYYYHYYVVFSLILASHIYTSKPSLCTGHWGSWFFYCWRTTPPSSCKLQASWCCIEILQLGGKYNGMGYCLNADTCSRTIWGTMWSSIAWPQSISCTDIDQSLSWWCEIDQYSANRGQIKVQSTAQDGLVRMSSETPMSTHQGRRLGLFIGHQGIL